MFFLFLFIVVFVSSCSYSETRKQAAEINGTVIYLDEIDSYVESELYYHLSEIYETRNLALSKLIETKIFQFEAAKRGMEYQAFLDSLYQKEIYNAPFKKNQLTYIRDSTGKYDISFEQGKDLMLRREERSLRKRWVDSLSAEYHVKISLKKPDKLLFIDMQDVKCYYKDSKDLPVTVWLISDFDCNVCKMLQPMFDSVLEKYNGKINLAFSFYSEMVSRASVAAECADRQNKFWEMKDMIYKDTDMDIRKYVKYANDIGMDTVQFKKDFDDPSIYELISNNLQILGKKGVFGTPTIVIGKRMYFNISSVDEFSALIEKHLN